jgi:hypothetical protein
MVRGPLLKTVVSGFLVPPAGSFLSRLFSAPSALSPLTSTTSSCLNCLAQGVDRWLAHLALLGRLGQRRPICLTQDRDQLLFRKSIFSYGFSSGSSDTEALRLSLRQRCSVLALMAVNAGSFEMVCSFPLQPTRSQTKAYGCDGTFQSYVCESA